MQAAYWSTKVMHKCKHKDKNAAVLETYLFTQVYKGKHSRKWAAWHPNRSTTERCHNDYVAENRRQLVLPREGKQIQSSHVIRNKQMRGAFLPQTAERAKFESQTLTLFDFINTFNQNGHRSLKEIVSMTIFCGKALKV